MKTEFIDQVTDIKIVTITEPRVYLRWQNSESGRDKFECYERKTYFDVVYVNVHNPDFTYNHRSKFFKVLEDMYNKALESENKG
jgi:hypothetical protein